MLACLSKNATIASRRLLASSKSSLSEEAGNGDIVAPVPYRNSKLTHFLKVFYFFPLVLVGCGIGWWSRGCEGAGIWWPLFFTATASWSNAWVYLVFVGVAVPRAGVVFLFVAVVLVAVATFVVRGAVVDGHVADYVDVGHGAFAVAPEGGSCCWW